MYKGISVSKYTTILGVLGNEQGFLTYIFFFPQNFWFLSYNRTKISFDHPDLYYSKDLLVIIYGHIEKTLNEIFSDVPKRVHKLLVVDLQS